MRPRHKAAEYLGIRRFFGTDSRVASMRPRHKAAEYPDARAEQLGAAGSASMRPRHKAAEYTLSEITITFIFTCFNEAAA